MTLRIFDRSVPGWELAIAMWLLALAVPPALAPDSLSFVQAAIVLVLFFAAIISHRAGFLYGPVYRHYPMVLFCTAGLIGVLIVSGILSEEPPVSLGYVGMTAVVLVLTGGVWDLTAGRMTACLRFYGTAGSAATGYFCLFREDYSQWFNGRLSFTSVSHPNYVGLISFGFLAASLAIRNPYLRLLCMAIDLAAMIFSQSRSAFVASIVCLACFGALTVWSDKRRRGLRLFATLGVLGLATASLPWTADWLMDAINDVLLLNDRYRGLGTGFTGRMEAWQEALELFQQNPFFGVGFRMHERYMVSLWSAHNGYLSMLADTGISGIAMTLLLMAMLAIRALRFGAAGSRTSRIAISFFAGYCIVAIFERVLLNAGNPTSLLLWILLMAPANRMAGLAPRPLELRTPEPAFAK
ncbi:MAG: O-antigen ligase family protein [Bryobacteraceae bacterium]